MSLEPMAESQVPAESHRQSPNTSESEDDSHAQPGIVEPRSRQARPQVVGLDHTNGDVPARVQVQATTKAPCESICRPAECFERIAADQRVNEDRASMTSCCDARPE